MEKKRSLQGTAVQLRRRFQERVVRFKNSPVADEKPTLGKFLLFIFLLIALGLLGLYLIGADSLFHSPANMNLSPQAPAN